MSIRKENGTANLIGRSFDNDTKSGEISNEMNLFVEFSTNSSGVFKSGACFGPSVCSHGFCFCYLWMHCMLMVMVVGVCVYLCLCVRVGCVR